MAATPRKKKSSNRGTVSITFGDNAENHVGMQHIRANMRVNANDDEDEARPLTLIDLKRAKKKFIAAHIPEEDCEIHELHRLLDGVDLRDANGGIIVPEEAYLLVVKGGVRCFTDPDELLTESVELKHDKTALMRGKVKNKLARWNVCYADEHQEPDIPNGKGTVYAFDEVPCVQAIREGLPHFFGEKTEGLVAELNWYYDSKKCGIGYHGDTERKIVVCCRVGEEIPMAFQWYLQTQPIGPKFEFTLESGSVYAMSGKAVGTDWKKRKIPTLRHAAGRKYV